MALEKTAIENALRDAGGNIGRAARILGTSKRTLQYRMRDYQMARGKAGRPRKLLGYARRSRGVLAVAAGVAAVAVGIAVAKSGGGTTT